MTRAARDKRADGFIMVALLLLLALGAAVMAGLL